MSTYFISAVNSPVMGHGAASPEGRQLCKNKDRAKLFSCVQPNVKALKEVQQNCCHCCFVDSQHKVGKVKNDPNQDKNHHGQMRALGWETPPPSPTSFWSPGGNPVCSEQRCTLRNTFKVRALRTDGSDIKWQGQRSSAKET